MGVIEVIKSRYSVRDFDSRPVSKENIYELIEAARLAPSAKNTQGFGYRVITEKEIIQELKGVKAFKRPFVYRAPLLLMGCIIPNAYLGASWENSREEVDQIVSRGMAKRDLAISMTFIVLRAQEMGLGSCYIGDMDHQAVLKVLKFPEGYTPDISMCIGYPKKQMKARLRKKSVEDLLI